MKIEINQTSPTLWGKLGVEETRIAAERLSGDGFKAWVLLALNQDGYIWKEDLERRTFHELSDCGYLTAFGDGSYLFRPDGEPEDFEMPAEWGKIAALYSSSGQQDFRCVRDKLQSACLDDRMQDILAYWAKKYRSLQELDHSKARNHLKYDFAVMLVWWLWDNFRFRLDDVLEVGDEAKRLRFHDGAFKSKIQIGVCERKITKIHMNEAAANFWNTEFAARKFEIPLECVAEILKNRNSPKETQ